ncbi:MAG TPA: FAD-linked oxidase C-terminal domain-containing protein, partial [Elusimicrobiales bacterium]|nr:FAD-linked oxidase C-terminal domain-containing protein [Elusimicrobiales bacterium]
LERLDKLLEIDTVAGYALVEAGVLNSTLQAELAREGFFYAPQPLSSNSSTLGGNVAVNSCGPRSLKYGRACDNLLAADVVSPEGKELKLSRTNPGPDLAGFFVGQEGTFGTAVRLKVKILKRRPDLHFFMAAFNSHEELLRAVAKAQSEGVCFRALEAFDRMTATAMESCFRLGYSLSCEVLAIGELDGTAESVAAELKILRHAFRACGCAQFHSESRDSGEDPAWVARRQAFSAVSRLAPSIVLEDFSVPRKKLGLALASVSAILAQHDLRAGLVYSPGTGALFPHILFDERNVFEARRVRRAAHEMLKTCADMGGAVSGCYGTGVEKRVALSWQYNDCELGLMHAFKELVDPGDLSNPEKILPLAKTKSHKKIEYSLSGPAQFVATELRKRAQRGAHTFIAGSGSRTFELSEAQRPMHLAATLGTAIQDFEADVMLKDGQTRTLLGNASPMREPGDRVSGAVGAFLDITERRRTEEA